MSARLQPEPKNTFIFECLSVSLGTSSYFLSACHQTIHALFLLPKIFLEGKKKMAAEPAIEKWKLTFFCCSFFHSSDNELPVKKKNVLKINFEGKTLQRT